MSETTGTFYYIPSCDTCRKVMKTLDLDQARLRDIKAQPLTEEEVERLAKKAGGYEALISKRARKFVGMGPETKSYGESDFRRCLLDHYTFMRRPAWETEHFAWVGRAAVEAAMRNEGEG